MTRQRTATLIAAIGACRLAPAWLGMPVWAAGRASNVPSNPQRKSIEVPRMSEHPFNLQGDEYWTQPFKNDDGLAERTIFKKQPGLFIDGPPIVDLAARDTIPIPIFSCTSQNDAARSPLMKHALLVATRLEDRQTFFGFATPRDRPLPKASSGPAASSTAMTTENLVPDLRKQAGIGDALGTYEVVVLVRERASNQVRVAVKKGNGYKDPAVEKFLQQQPVPKPAPVSPTPASGAGLPRYRRGPASPELPAVNGVALAGPASAVLHPGAPIELAGSFRVPLLKRELTGASPGQGAATAIVPMTLMAFSSAAEGFGPFVMRMRVPTYDAVAGPDPTGTGFFSVNLMDLAGLPARPATLFVYAFMGEWMSGPVRVDLTSR